MASVLGEGDGFGAGGEAVEEPAGVDRVQLFRVADEHDLRVGVVGGVEEHGELAGAGHGCFIDDEDGPCVEGQVAFLQLEDAQRDRVRRDAGLGLELRGGGRGERSTDHGVAGATPGVGGGVETERLSGPGRGDEDIDPVPRARQPSDRGDLLAGQFRPGGERGRQCVVGRDAVPAVDGFFGSG